MSKASLKKELMSLDHDQLVEVILNAYSSSKEAKEYFEFFLNPDADTLLEKKTDIIAKELNRTRRGYSKARISAIRNTIRDFAAYGPGDEYVYRLMLDTIRMIVGMERYIHYPDALNNGVIRLTADFTALADGMEAAGQACADLERMNDDNIGRPYFREKVLHAARLAIHDISSAQKSKK